MALTPSNMLALGTKAPSFQLLNVTDNKTYHLDDIKGKNGTLIMFVCAHCPYVIHVQDKIVEISNAYQKQGVNFIAISSNDVENYPQDAPNKLKEQAINVGFNFPYLYDETQAVAKAYDAACTPDFYLFDKHLKLFYRGKMDDSTPGNNEPNNGKDMTLALNLLLENKPAPEKQEPSMGCNIKWK